MIFYTEWPRLKAERQKSLTVMPDSYTGMPAIALHTSSGPTSLGWKYITTTVLQFCRSACFVLTRGTQLCKYDGFLLGNTSSYWNITQITSYDFIQLWYTIFRHVLQKKTFNVYAALTILKRGALVYWLISYHKHYMLREKYAYALS